MDLVHLDPGLVAPVAEHAAFPLGAGNAVKPAIFQRTHPLIAQIALDLRETFQRLVMDA